LSEKQRSGTEMDYTKRAQALRDVKERHYNCCQAALLPFAEEQGLDHEDICRLAAQFGAGMRRGSVCGAATGGLMALGLLGADEETAVEFQRRFRARAGAMDCRDLLEAAQKQGEEKKPHCDRVVALAVALVDELTAGKER